MHKPPIIGIDLMGADVAPEVLLTDVVQFLATSGMSCQLMLFGDEKVLQELENHPDYFAVKPQLILEATTETIETDDSPAKATFVKSDSSLCRAMKALASQRIAALISCCNTGAFISAAVLSLPLLEICSRPSLSALIPVRKSPLALVDAGANVTSRDSHLINFSLLGALYKKIVDGVALPKVGLLNICREAIKGRPIDKSCYQKLCHSRLATAFHFIGNIEPPAALKKPVDVLVSDGHSGNIFLKTIEGTLGFACEILELLGLGYHQPQQQLKSYLRCPGALLLGVKRIAMKCHGNASKETLSASINFALKLLQENFLTKIEHSLQQLRD